MLLDQSLTLDEDVVLVVHLMYSTFQSTLAHFVLQSTSLTSLQTHLLAASLALG